MKIDDYREEIKVVRMMKLPLRATDIIKFLVWYTTYYGRYSCISEQLVTDTLIVMWENRLVDINFDEAGHPWIVYSNWTTVCPIIKKMGRR